VGQGHRLLDTHGWLGLHIPPRVLGRHRRQEPRRRRTARIPRSRGRRALRRDELGRAPGGRHRLHTQDERLGLRAAPLVRLSGVRRTTPAGVADRRWGSSLRHDQPRGCFRPRRDLPGRGGRFGLLGAPLLPPGRRSEPARLSDSGGRRALRHDARWRCRRRRGDLPDRRRRVRLRRAARVLRRPGRRRRALGDADSVRRLALRNDESGRRIRPRNGVPDRHRRLGLRPAPLVRGRRRGRRLAARWTDRRVRGAVRDDANRRRFRRRHALPDRHGRVRLRPAALIRPGAVGRPVPVRVPRRGRGRALRHDLHGRRYGVLRSGLPHRHRWHRLRSPAFVHRFAVRRRHAARQSHARRRGALRHDQWRWSRGPRNPDRGRNGVPDQPGRNGLRGAPLVRLGPRDRTGADVRVAGGGRGLSVRDDVQGRRLGRGCRLQDRPGGHGCRTGAFVREPRRPVAVRLVGVGRRRALRHDGARRDVGRRHAVLRRPGRLGFRDPPLLPTLRRRQRAAPVLADSGRGGACTA